MTRVSLAGAFGALVVVTGIWELAASAEGGASRSAIAGFRTLAVFGGAEPGYLAAAFVTTRAIAQSVYRIAICLAVGYPAGLFAATVLHAVPFGPEGSHALLTPLRATPLLALVPLFNIWFGDSELGLFLYLAFAISIFVAVGALSALERMPAAMSDQARILRLSSARRLFVVLFPAAHYSMSDVREALASLVWAFALAAEFLASGSGLGDFVSQAYRNNNVGQLAALLVIYAALALLTVALTRAGEVTFSWNRGAW